MLARRHSIAGRANETTPALLQLPVRVCVFRRAESGHKPPLDVPGPGLDAAQPWWSGASAPSWRTPINCTHGTAPPPSVRSPPARPRAAPRRHEAHTQAARGTTPQISRWAFLGGTLPAQYRDGRWRTTARGERLFGSNSARSPVKGGVDLGLALSLC